MIFFPSLTNIGEFLITGNGYFVLVGIRFARRIRAALAEIEAEYAEAIVDLQLAPRTGPVSCELWLYSRYGTLRYFRVNDTALAEIDQYGMPLPRAKPAAVTGPAENEQTPDGSVMFEVPAAGPVDKRGAVLRYLAKWNAARLAGKKVWEMDGSETGAIPGTGKTAGMKKRASRNRPAPADPVTPESTGAPREKGGSPG
jgi:hypothetical protein